MTRSTEAYTDLRALPLPSRPKSAVQILEESADRAQAAGDVVMAFQLRRKVQQAIVEALRQ